MAFPVVQTADTQNGVVTTNSNAWSLTYPTNLEAGDLILALLGTDGTTVGAGFAFPADWVPGGQTATACTLLLGKKVSNGTETGNFTVNLNASEQGGWRVFRITGWEGTVGTTFGNEVAGGAVIGGTPVLFAQTGSSTTPDPPSCNPGNWDVEDTLWIAVCALDTSRTISFFPLGNLQTSNVSGGSGGATLGICMANSAVAVLDATAFTISASDDWVATTLAIRPAGAATPVSSGPELLNQRRTPRRRMLQRI